MDDHSAGPEAPFPEGRICHACGVISPPEATACNACGDALGKADYAFARKWGPEIERGGFTQVSNFLTNFAGVLELSFRDVAFLIDLMTHWWRGDGRLPHPSHARLARHFGVHEKTVEKAIADLAKRGLIEIHPNYVRQNNGYSFNGLKSLLRIVFAYRQIRGAGEGSEVRFEDWLTEEGFLALETQKKHLREAAAERRSRRRTKTPA